MNMKYIKKIDEHYSTAPAPVKTPVKTPTEPTTPVKRPWSPTRPPRRDNEEMPGPRNTVEKSINRIINKLLLKISKRYNSLISKKSNESLEDNLGISKEYLDRLKASFPAEDTQDMMADTREVVRLLTAIRESEKDYTDRQKKEFAIDIVNNIFTGEYGIDLEDIEFKLHILHEDDLMDARRGTTVGIPPDEAKDINTEIKDRDPDLKKEIDVRNIQAALSNGFASMVKDDFVLGDAEIPGVSFEDYYNLMNKTFGLHSKIPNEYLHELITHSSAVGRVEILWNEDKGKYIIDASGYTILILVHEMIKGIYELMAMQRPLLGREKNREMRKQTETQYMEREGLQYGPGLVGTFKEFFDKVEENLIRDGSIQVKNPRMIPAVLAKFYTLEADLFLRVSKSIWNDDDSDEGRPFDLFESFYMEIIDGGGGDDEPDMGDYPMPIAPEPGQPGETQDDELNDLLSGAGISLNMGPVEENLKYIIPFDVYGIFEDYTEQWEKWINAATKGGGRGSNKLELQKAKETIAYYINDFQNLTGRGEPDRDLKRAMTNPDIGGNVPDDWNSRKNVEQYGSFDDFKEVVDAGRRASALAKKSELKTGDFGQAVSQIQKAFGIEEDGYYARETESAIRKFQQEFGEDTNNNKLIKIILKNLIEYGADLQDTATLDSFKGAAEGLRDTLKEEMLGENDNVKKNELQQKIDLVSKNLKQINSISTGGLARPSGKADSGTIAAIMAQFDIEKLHGIGGNVGTLKPSEGHIVYASDNINVYRVLSMGYSIQCRADFERVLVGGEGETGLGAAESVYNFCTSWKPSVSHYSKYRNKEHNTIYFIENKQRAAAEWERWKQFVDAGGDISGLTGTAGTTDAEFLKFCGAPQEGDDGYSRSPAKDPHRRYYDDYHIAIIFVYENENGGNSYWLVSASNDGEWGNPNVGDESTKYPPFTFEKIAEVLWPETAGQSIRNPIHDQAEGMTKPVITVPRKVIASSNYQDSKPSSKQLDEIKNIIIPVELSPKEIADKEGDATSPTMTVQRFELSSYEEKEAYLKDMYWAMSDIHKDHRNTNRVEPDMWKAMPAILKRKHLANSWTGLDDDMFKEIADTTDEENVKTIKQHRDFLRRRLYGSRGSGGLIDHIDTEVGHGGNVLSSLEKNMLQPNEVKLLQKYDIVTKIYDTLRNGFCPGIEKGAPCEIIDKFFKKGTGKRENINLKVPKPLTREQKEEAESIADEYTGTDQEMANFFKVYPYIFKKLREDNPDLTGEQKDSLKRAQAIYINLKEWGDLTNKYRKAITRGLKKAVKDSGGKLLKGDNDLPDPKYKKLNDLHTINKLREIAKYGNPEFDIKFGGNMFHKLASDSKNAPNPDKIINRLLGRTDRKRVAMDRWMMNNRNTNSLKIDDYVKQVLLRLLLNDEDRTPSFDKFKNIFDYLIRLDSAPEAAYLLQLVMMYYDFNKLQKKLPTEEKRKLFKIYDDVLDHYGDLFTSKEKGRITGFNKKLGASASIEGDENQVTEPGTQVDRGGGTHRGYED